MASSSSLGDGHLTQGVKKESKKKEKEDKKEKKVKVGQPLEFTPRKIDKSTRRKREDSWTPTPSPIRRDMAYFEEDELLAGRPVETLADFMPHLFLY